MAADFGRAGRPFRICAFDDESDSEQDDELKERFDDINAISISQSNVQSTVADTNANGQHRISGKSDSPAQGLFHAAEIDKPWLLSRSETSEGLVLELEHERLQKIQEEVRQRRSVLEASIEEETSKATASIQQVVKEEDLKKETAHRKDQLYQRSIAEVRDTHLSALQREHEQRSQVEERKIRKEAEARKREILAREERERQEKLKAEAEAKKKSDAILAAEAERKKKAEAAAAAALQRAEAERMAKAAQEQNAGEQATRETAASVLLSETRTTTEPKPIVSKVAADLEQMRHKKLEEALEASRSLQMNTPLKKVLKERERNLTKLLQQVSATQEQVRTKSSKLMTELAPSPHQPFALTTFASKLMSQCEIQGSSGAFALAQVVVNISLHIPELMEVVLATMNQVCIFTVPKYCVFKKSQYENDEAYFKVCGYKEKEGKLESTDEYADRMTAYVTLYAAITQAVTDGGANRHGLKEGWAWCARLLNSLPADRLTASALAAFLKVAGFRMCQVYKQSFMKMLHVISTEFIRNLKQQDDVASSVSRLETYIATRQYLTEPEGFRMARTDFSSTFRC